MGMRDARGKGRDKRPVDDRPYVGDVARGRMGRGDFAATAAGMVILALVMGLVVGLLIFLVMTLSTWLTDLIWGGYLGGAAFALFPLVVCTAGGLAIGLWTHFSGSRIASLEEVMATFKRTGSYRVPPARGAVSFLLPLVFGGSVGFEAGLTGLIASGCCWIRDKLKAAGLRAGEIADLTIAASLSAVFGTPLAGIVAGAQSAPAGSGDVMAEGDVLVEGGARAEGMAQVGEGGALTRDVDAYNLRKPAKIVLYAAAAFGAFGGISLCSELLGAESGFPRFEAIDAQGLRYLWVLPALVAAYLMTLVYHGSGYLFGCVLPGSRAHAPTSPRESSDEHSHETPGESPRESGSALGTILRPVVAGVIMGALAMAFPYVLFPGETQSHMLMESWTTWTAAALVATGVLKAFVTPMCIGMGWVGGNFCPCIFAGAAVGYGIAMVTGADPVLMVTVVTTGFLAGVLRKPVLALAVLLLCFPARSLLWCGVVAVICAVLPVPRRFLERD